MLSRHLRSFYKNMLSPLLKALGSDYSIGMVTYVRRFENIFKPIVRDLEKYFPDVEKNFVLNGYYDPVLQEKYLTDAKAFLKTASAKNVVAYQENQCISRCWNQLMLHSTKPKVLILSDDIAINRLFRPSLELQLWTKIFTPINHTWSYMVVSKDIIKKVGWFEERFPGNGLEDGDYALRMAMSEGKKEMKGQSEKTIYCFGIKNLMEKNEDPGWKNFSGSVDDRYTSVNQDFFDKKWEKSKTSLPNSIYGFNSDYYRIRPGMETPNFYDLSLLDNPLSSPL
jgi:hypothetical protein